MLVSLSIIRYKKRYILFAFFAMLLFRFPLWRNKQISFYKLLGCGKNGSFDTTPDLQQWGIMTVYRDQFGIKCSGPFPHNENLMIEQLYGTFISKWLRLFNCETYTILLQPIEGHGHWNGKAVFGDLPKHAQLDGMIASITRATIRLKNVQSFWKTVPAVTASMKSADGFITSLGIGEIPWITPATFSVWKNKDCMAAFAYKGEAHAAAMKKTRDGNWFKEDLFVRFKILTHTGTMKGIDPLKVKL